LFYYRKTCFVAPSVTGAPGISTKKAIKYLKIIPDRHSIDSTKTKSRAGNTRIIKVLESENLKTELCGAPLVEEDNYREIMIVIDDNNKK